MGQWPVSDAELLQPPAAAGRGLLFVLIPLDLGRGASHRPARHSGQGWTPADRDRAHHLLGLPHSIPHLVVCTPGFLGITERGGGLVPPEPAGRGHLLVRPTECLHHV